MEPMTRTARPKSFAVCAFVFFWLALAGLANTWGALTYPSKYGQLGIDAAVLAAVSAIYGLTAALVTIGFWRVERWLPQAILLWGASLIIGVIAFQAMVGAAWQPSWLAALPHVLFALIIWSLFRFTQRRVSVPAPAI